MWRLRLVRTGATVLLPWSLVGPWIVSGCSSSPTSSIVAADAGTARPPPATVDAGAGGAGLGTAEDASAPAVVRQIRFAHLAPGLGSVDFCWRASADDPFHGPLLAAGGATTSFDAGPPDEPDAGGDASAGDASAREDAGAFADAGPDDGGSDAGDGGAPSPEPSDAGPTPLGYLSVSPTVSLASNDEIDVIAVEPGTTCAAPLVLGHVVLPAAPRTTLLLAGGAQGDASGGLGILSFGDEVTASSLDGESIRVVNASLVPDMGSFAAALDVAGAIVPLASDVEPRSASSESADGGSPEVDALGYTALPPTNGAPALRIALTDAAANGGATWISAARTYALTAGEVATAFVGHDEQGYVVLWCNDATPPVADAGASWTAVR